MRAERYRTGRIPARLPWLLAALVAAWTLVTFLPTVWNDFVNWDDPRMFLENPYHRGPWLQEFRYAWSSHLLGEFMPVTWMSYTLDRMLWGLHAPGYHLTSLILHVLAALAVFVLARRLLRHALGTGSDRAAPRSTSARRRRRSRSRSTRSGWSRWPGWAPGGPCSAGCSSSSAVLVYVMGWERGRKTGTVPARWLPAPSPCSSASLLARATGARPPGGAGGPRRLPAPRLGWAAGRGGWGPAARRVWTEKAVFAR